VWVAGPAGGILADWGADVIKIEPRARAANAAELIGSSTPQAASSTCPTVWPAHR